MQLEENLGPNSTPVLAVGGEMGTLCPIFIVSTLGSMSVSAAFSDHIYIYVYIYSDFKLSFVIKNKHLLYLQLGNIVLDEKQ